MNAAVLAPRRPLPAQAGAQPCARRLAAVRPSVRLVPQFLRWFAVLSLAVRRESHGA